MDDEKRAPENKEKEQFDSDSMKCGSAVDIGHEENAVGAEEKIIASENERRKRQRSFSDEERSVRDLLNEIRLSSTTVETLEQENFKTIKDLELLDSANIKQLNLPFRDQLKLLELVDKLKTKQRQTDQTSSPNSEISSAQKRKQEESMQHFEFDGMTIAYKIEASIGSGGFGNVFKARVDGKVFSKSINNHTNTLAIKLLINNTTSDEEFQEHLHEIEEITKRLQSMPYHRNLIELFGVHTYKSPSLTEGNHVAITMEYCSGGSLEDVTKRNRKPELWQMIAYLRQTAFGLAHLHRQNIVHRDLKPANILINKCPQTGEEIIKLADVDDVVVLKGDATLAGEVDLKGTVKYFSPEMAEKYGNPQVKIGRSTDIWSFGYIVLDVLFGSNKKIIKTANETLKVHQNSNDYHIIRMLGLGGVPSSETGDVYIPRTVAVNDLLKECFRKDPKDRWTADKLTTELPWLYCTEHCQVFEKTMQIYMQSPNDTVKDSRELYYRDIPSSPALYYRDMRRIFNEFLEIKPNIIRDLCVTIYRQAQLVDLFSGVNNMIKGLRFHAIHGWTNEVIRGVNLPHLYVISFSQCQDVSFKKGDWQFLPNLKEIRFDEDSSILELEDNFLLELPSLSVFDVNCSVPSASAIRNLQLLQSLQYDWFHQYIKKKDEENGTSLQSGIKTKGIEPSDLTKLEALLIEPLISEKTKSCSQIIEVTQNEVWDEWEKFRSSRSSFPGPHDKLYCTSSEEALLNQTEFKLKDLLERRELIEKELRCLQEDPVRLDVYAESNSSWTRDFTQFFPQFLNQFQWQVVCLSIHNICDPLAYSLENFYLPCLLELRFHQCVDVLVTRKSFIGFPKLRALIMQITTVFCIEEEVFRQLPDLKYLALDYQIWYHKNLYGVMWHLKRFHESNDYEWLREKFRLEPTLIGKKFKGELWEFKSSQHYICSEVFRCKDAFLVGKDYYPRLLDDYGYYSLDTQDLKAFRREYQKNIPPFRMENYTLGEIAKVLTVEAVSCRVGTHKISTFKLTESDEGTVLWVSLEAKPWTINISSNLASTSNAASLLTKPLTDLLNLKKNHPIGVQIDMKNGVSSESIQALSILGENVIQLSIRNGENIMFNETLAKLELPNLLDLVLDNCANMTLRKGCFDKFPIMRRFAVVGGGLPKMENNIFQNSFTLQSIEFSTVAESSVKDLMWLKEYLSEYSFLVEHNVSGQVWEFEKNGYKYFSFSTAPLERIFASLTLRREHQKEYQKNIPPFRMEKYTLDEIAKALTVEGESRRVGTHQAITFKLTESDEDTHLWMWVRAAPWVINISSSLASTLNTVSLLNKRLQDLLSLNKNHPMRVEIDMKNGITIETIQALSILGENVIDLWIHNGKNILFNDTLAKLELPNLLDLILDNCTNMTLQKDCFNRFPIIRRFAVVAGGLPKMEDNIFENRSTLQSIEFRGAAKDTCKESQDFNWLREYLNEYSFLIEPKTSGQVWEYEMNGYQYFSLSTSFWARTASSSFRQL